MKTSLVHPLLGITAALFLASTGVSAEETRETLRFSNPAAPGTLRVSVARGDIRIKGDDSNEVAIRSDAGPRPPARKDGLRVLTEASGFSVREQDNVITVDATSDGWAGAPSDFDIVVPRNTSVIVTTLGGGDVQCTAVEGDIEIKSLHGKVVLEDVVGSAVVESMNGEIEARIRELREGRPLSFTSMNGVVLLRVPEAAQASLRLRTQNGTILTDFDDKALTHRVESSGRHPSKRRSQPVLDEETRRAIREVGRAGAEVARRTAEALREAAAAAREGAEVIAGAEQPGAPRPPIPPVPPLPPLPAIPTLTGGKLVTGTLNGGGPEINVTTMNGDVILRRIEK